MLQCALRRMEGAEHSGDLVCPSQIIGATKKVASAIQQQIEPPFLLHRHRLCDRPGQYAEEVVIEIVKRRFFVDGCAVVVADVYVENSISTRMTSNGVSCLMVRN